MYNNLKKKIIYYSLFIYFFNNYNIMFYCHYLKKKIFKIKCFSTGYIKNLSTLFLNDQGKYNFFDAAYPYVSDTGIFSTLENQLSDAYYIKRFKAMIHQ